MGQQTIETALIDGFEVEAMKMSDPSDPQRGEWVEVFINKGRASNSLAVVEDFGALAYGEESEVKMSAKTLEKIISFAKRLGYYD